MATLKLTKEDKSWATAVKDRDNWTCIVCGLMQGDSYNDWKGRPKTAQMNAHHLLPRERHDTKYDLLNGVTLCVKHHLFNREISAHNNPIAFTFWLLENKPLIADYLRSKL